ncbi:hypothetical protein HK405_001519 [Cladochytrium tenue]|nr:hypothetical protein HK405_001519 [Cladochytrium tenue]
MPPTATAVPAAAMVWFRMGLRLHDCDPLRAAMDLLASSAPPPLSSSATTSSSSTAATSAVVRPLLVPFFVIDPYYGLQPGGSARGGPRRWVFLLQSLRALDASLRERGSRLLVLRGDPIALLPALWSAVGASHVFAMWQDGSPHVTQRDARVRALASAAGVTFVHTGGHLLYPVADVLRRNDGTAPLTYQAYLRTVAKLPSPPPPADPPTKLPPVTDTAVAAIRDALIAASSSATADPGTQQQQPLHHVAGPAGNFSVPTVAELGFAETEDALASRFRGGEDEALRALDAYMEQKTKVLKFGTLSPRLFYHRLQAAYAAASGRHSHPPVSLLGQLLWREFYYCAAAATPNFGRMEGNPVCRQIDWWCRDGRDDPRNPDAARLLAAWTDARTGYPWIDAIMTQLRVDGWMHHLARHSVACFLTRGDLFISWERGAEVFEELLLDHDWSLNIGNWLWLSASAFFHQYFRVYSPVSFGKKYDKQGKPWKAPVSVLRAAGVVLGENYPRRIVDHDVAMKANMARMKAAFDASREGGVGGDTAGNADAGDAGGADAREDAVAWPAPVTTAAAPAMTTTPRGSAAASSRNINARRRQRPLADFFAPATGAGGSSKRGRTE